MGNLEKIEIGRWYEGIGSKSQYIVKVVDFREDEKEEYGSIIFGKEYIVSNGYIKFNSLCSFNYSKELIMLCGQRRLNRTLPRGHEDSTIKISNKKTITGLKEEKHERKDKPIEIHTIEVSKPSRIRQGTAAVRYGGQPVSVRSRFKGNKAISSIGKTRITTSKIEGNTVVSGNHRPTRYSLWP
jgi:hypothetical protein